MHNDQKFVLTYSEALLIRQALEQICFPYMPRTFSEEQKKMAEALDWKIKDAFC